MVFNPWFVAVGISKQTRVAMSNPTSKKQKKSTKKSIKLHSDEPIEDFTDRDVRLGKGKGSYDSTGNAHLLSLIEHYHPQIGNNHKLKRETCKHIVQQICREGGRFITKTQGKWYQVSEKEAIDKVVQNFRNRTRKGAPKRFTASAADSGNHLALNGIVHMPTDPQMLSIQRLQRAIQAVLQASSAQTLDNSPHSRAEEEDRFLNDNQIRSAIMEMARTMRLNSVDGTNPPTSLEVSEPSASSPPCMPISVEHQGTTENFDHVDPSSDST